ncbi:MAG TPA: RluA family pseudouridine synthase [Planctomycetota bacterium]|nr:RluA family pseudouridine synthase [Planctomycetota bacterium]
MSGKSRNRLEILHLDDHLAVVNKAAGVPVVPTRSGRGESLRELLAVHLGTPPFVVHRIDRDTTGVVLFARDAPTHRELSLMFEHREVEKVYLAVVRGHPDPAAGTIELPLQRDRHDPTRMTVARRGGKPCRTDYRTVETFRGYALVEVKPWTGRMHQIRVHLSAIGHPLAVDPVYGGTRAVCLSEFKRDYRQKKGREERPLISRLSLHASVVRLGRPLTHVGAARFEAPLSHDLDVFLKQLAKHASLPRPAH